MVLLLSLRMTDKGRKVPPIVGIGINLMELSG
jgi:hypothetical protein